MIKNIIITVLAVAVLALGGALYYINQIDNQPAGQSQTPAGGSGGGNDTDNNSNDGPDQPADEEDWLTYSDPVYGFTVEYPADWRFATDVVAGEPRFSIYKEGQPPLSHHVNSTQVSVFPRGLGTEGPVGESRTISADLTAATESMVVEHYLSNNVPRGYYVRFSDAPASWEDYGYVWGAVAVQNLQAEEVPAENPDFMPTSRLSGQVSAQDFATVKRILASFEFAQ